MLHHAPEAPGSRRCYCAQLDAPVCVVASGTRWRYAPVMGPEPKKPRRRSPRQGPRKPLAVRNAKGQQAALAITDGMRRKVENLVAADSRRSRKALRSIC